MPSLKRRTPRRRERTGELTREQAIELLIGTHTETVEHFASDSDRREAWQHHRAGFVGGLGWKGFTRPSAWWRYEADFMTTPHRYVAPGRQEPLEDWFVRNRVPLVPDELSHLRQHRSDLFAIAKEGPVEEATGAE
jgi:hypothetical protein